MDDEQLKEILKTMCIIIDSREKLPNHITELFDDVGVKWEKKKLNSGDYCAYIPINEQLGITEKIEATIAIERKYGLQEIGANLTTHRNRFKREFARKDKDMLIMIENDTYDDIINHNYKNKVSTNSFLASLHSISTEYNIPFIFISADSSPIFIYKTLYYNLRNILKQNNLNNN